MPPESDLGTALSASPTDAALPIPSIHLTVLDGPNAGKRASIRQGAAARVGTAPTNHLVLTDRTVSRIHCEIGLRAGSVTLRDLGSTNGTFVDGRRVRDV